VPEHLGLPAAATIGPGAAIEPGGSG
jgi:hypothetical protein